MTGRRVSICLATQQHSEREEISSLMSIKDISDDETLSGSHDPRYSVARWYTHD